MPNSELIILVSQLAVLIIMGEALLEEDGRTLDGRIVVLVAVGGGDTIGTISNLT